MARQTVGAVPKSARRALLTDFLKKRRARLSPADFGFGDGTQTRRTPGLRRSEVARLAGVSTEWYTLFEMGRDRAMTQRIIERVVRALQLNQAERDYLYDLVREETPPHRSGQLHPSIEFALQNARRGAVSVYDPWLTRLHANDIAREIFLFEDHERWLQSNIVWRLFSVPVAREFSGARWREHARRNIGLFRRSLARDPLNPDARAIIDALQGKPDFDELWGSHEVYSFEMYSRDSMVAPDVFCHPKYGRLVVQTIVLQLPDWAGAHVRYVTPADDDTAEVMREIGR